MKINIGDKIGRDKMGYPKSWIIPAIIAASGTVIWVVYYITGGKTPPF